MSESGMVDIAFAHAVREVGELFSQIGLNERLEKEAKSGATRRLVEILESTAGLGAGEAEYLAELLRGELGRARGDRSDRFPIKAAKRRMLKVAKLQKKRLTRRGVRSLDAKAEAARWTYKRWGKKLGMSASTIERQMDARLPKTDREGRLILDRPDTDE